MSADDAVRAIIAAVCRRQMDADSTALSAAERRADLGDQAADHAPADSRGSSPFRWQQSAYRCRPNLDSANDQTLTEVATSPIPSGKSAGPWDVDNDNDGVRDSVWVDLGDPIQETEDGRRYKTLYAFLCIDLDSRLNVNAHGLADDIVPPLLDTTKANYFDPTHATGPWVGNLVHDPANWRPACTVTAARCNWLAELGYGPAEISLRPLFPAPLDTSFAPRYGNRDESAGPIDSYAALLSGRLNINGKVIYGRYGYDFNLSAELKG